MCLHKQKRRPGTGSGVWTNGCSRSYLPILWTCSPAAFLDDSTCSPPLLPNMLTKPRTVCACHSVHFQVGRPVSPESMLVYFPLERRMGAFHTSFIACSRRRSGRFSPEQ